MFNFPAYMGKTTSDVADFMDNYGKNIGQFAVAIGLEPDTVTYTVDCCKLFVWLEKVFNPELRQAAKAGTDARDVFAGDNVPSPFVPKLPTFTPPPVSADTLNDGFVGFLDNQIKQIRLTPAYKQNPQIGIVLRIADTTPAPVTPDKAVLAGLSAQAGFKMEVRALRYKAKTVLFYDMADPTNPKLLATLPTAIFEDERPPTVPGQSEMRSYAVRYGDAKGKPLPNSIMSDIVSLSTHP